MTQRKMLGCMMCVYVCVCARMHMCLSLPSTTSTLLYIYFLAYTLLLLRKGVNLSILIGLESRRHRSRPLKLNIFPIS